MASETESTPRERLENLLKTPYPADGDLWSAYLAAFAAEYDELEAAVDEVEASKFVETSTNGSLDKLATIFDRERPTDEDDQRYRLRIQTALRELLGDATLDEMQDAVAMLLDDDPSNVVVREPDDAIARMDIGVEEASLDERNVTAGEFADFVSGLSAGGVDVESFALGTFMYVSEGEDPTVEGTDRGYASLDNPDTGGTYASLLQE
jgi:hypothetical protein